MASYDSKESIRQRMEQVKKGGGFNRGDVVWTPLRRKAVLKRFRDDGFWSARYQGESNYAGGVILQPKHLKLVDDPI